MCCDRDANKNANSVAAAAAATINTAAKFSSCANGGRVMFTIIQARKRVLKNVRGSHTSRERHVHGSFGGVVVGTGAAMGIAPQTSFMCVWFVFMF